MLIHKPTARGCIFFAPLRTDPQERKYHDGYRKRVQRHVAWRLDPVSGFDVIGGRGKRTSDSPPPVLPSLSDRSPPNSSTVSSHVLLTYRRAPPGRRGDRRFFPCAIRGLRTTTLRAPILVWRLTERRRAGIDEAARCAVWYAVLRRQTHEPDLNLMPNEPGVEVARPISIRLTGVPATSISNPHARPGRWSAMGQVLSVSTV
ncbi:uncharacterized protein BO66DRAFT_123165 [Aspergillus aculeatinus CBS 121060]|uniref:Uncharacterized protein n=1 Tax=Aspergillus aculeatinus CBS 121060 TaxID=1448322 RepID=A0ACD1H5E1_9EURO|nr:hypothetical protein BO66DRAFT_123165 [Aspergillus aculeatinus CBS 121060]RAH68630.1 hypothetical protein BO66DRAFT_123165 [Aspergillus aculeatinus CBS 121060]